MTVSLKESEKAILTFYNSEDDSAEAGTPSK
jgi:hypothetical protein